MHEERCSRRLVYKHPVEYRLECCRHVVTAHRGQPPGIRRLPRIPFLHPNLKTLLIRCPIHHRCGPSCRLNRLHCCTWVALSHCGYPPNLRRFQDHPRSSFARSFDLYPLSDLDNDPHPRMDKGDEQKEIQFSFEKLEVCKKTGKRRPVSDSDRLVLSAER